MHKKEISQRDLKIFGLIWAAIFLVIAYKSKNHAMVFIVIASVFLLTAIFQPQIYLRIKLYQNWIKFGNILGKINGFIISFILFYGIFAPVGIVLRMLGKDLLAKKADPFASSYFIDRKSQPGDMKNQF